MGRIIGRILGISLLTIIVIWLVDISIKATVFLLTRFGKNRKALKDIVPLWLQKLLGVSKIDTMDYTLFMFIYGWSLWMVILLLGMHFYFRILRQ